MGALQNYLSWQAELGGDEVMLEAPWARPAASGGRPGIVTSEGADTTGKGTSPSAIPGEGPSSTGESSSLFSMLANSLVESQENAKAVRRAAASGSAGTGVAPGAPRAAAAPGAPRAAAAPGGKPEPSLPAFADLAACRAYLAENMRGLFTGDVQGLAWQPVHGAGPLSAPLAVAALEASTQDALAGLPFQGPAGALLEKMMRAIRFDLGTLYRTQVIKLAGPGPGRRCYTRRDLVKLLPLFHAELELAGVPMVLLLGEACAQAVLKTGRGLEELRLAAHRVEGAPGREFVVTYHPDELEGNEDLKRKAWKDLQWLQARLQGS